MVFRETWKFVKNRIFSSEQAEGSVPAPDNNPEQVSGRNDMATVNEDMEVLLEGLPYNKNEGGTTNAHIDTTKRIEDTAIQKRLAELAEERKRNAERRKIVQDLRPQVGGILSSQKAPSPKRLDRFASGVIRRRNQGGFQPGGFFKFLDIKYAGQDLVGPASPLEKHVKMKALTNGEMGDFIRDMIASSAPLREIGLECFEHREISDQYISRVVDQLVSGREIGNLLLNRSYYPLFERMVKVIDKMSQGNEKIRKTYLIGQLGTLSLYAWLFNELTNPILQQSGMTIQDNPESPQCMTYLTPESIGIVLSGQKNMEKPVHMSWMLDREKLISQQDLHSPEEFLKRHHGDIHESALTPNTVIDTTRINTYLRPLMIHTPAEDLDVEVIERLERQFKTLAGLCRQLYLGR